MSWNNVIPAWAVGNPYGPVPSDGKYYYFVDGKQGRIGPFDSLEEAKKAMKNKEIEDKLYRIFNEFHSTRMTRKFSLDAEDVAFLLEWASVSILGKSIYKSEAE